tara:strand:+ start:1830 stop:2075 length:246 start_codon:yes stop_codon:yes gene_type:complete
MKKEQVLNALDLLSELRDVLENGDCVEDYDTVPLMGMAIPHMITLLNDWVTNLRAYQRLLNMNSVMDKVIDLLDGGSDGKA